MNWTAADTWIAVTGALAAMACALPGAWLVLRRMSMMGDAISHAVLPGLVLAFLLSGTREPLPMLGGAVGVGILTAVLVQLLHRKGRIDEGAAMGVVFTSLFALGLVLVARVADRVDLDPGCVLYGAITLAPLDTRELFGVEVPRAAILNGAMLAINGLLALLFHKELRAASFDAEFAEASGIPVGLVHLGLMASVAATCVAAFESVGSVLVVAMLIVPGACARLLTDRLAPLLLLSLAVAAASAAIGHVGAIVVPGWFGADATNTAGCIAVAAGLLFFAAMVFSPSQGIVPALLRRTALRLRVAQEDALGALWRAQESAAAVPAVPSAVALLLRRRGLLRDGLLTRDGENAARALVRTHRLWERYLVDEGGEPARAVHPQAELLEHVTSSDLQARLDRATGSPAEDPMGKGIPRG